MFSIILATMMSFAGQWSLPIDMPMTITIVQHNNEVGAILRAKPKEDKPFVVIMTGTVSREKCGDFIKLTSALMNSAQCKITVALMACGRLQKNSYNSKGLLIFIKECKSGNPSYSAFKIVGTWYKTKKL